MQINLSKLATLLAVVAVGTMLYSCKQNPASSVASESYNQALGGKNPPPPPPPSASPVIAQVTQAYVGKGAKQVLWTYLQVMNADGSNLTTVASSSGAAALGSLMQYNFGFPQWSPWSTSTIIYDRVTTASHYTLRAIDISVVNGVPVGSNDRQIVDITASGVKGSLYYGLSPSTTQQEIAFGDAATLSLYTIPATGGTPTLLYNGRGVNPSAPTWSPDAKYIAFTAYDTTTKEHLIRVIDRATGTVQYELCRGMFATVWSLQWSHSGSNTLAFYASPTAGGPTTLYNINAAAGSTPAAAGKSASWVSWSPDNSKILCTNQSTGSLDIYTLATGASTTIAAVSGAWVNWKW